MKSKISVIFCGVLILFLSLSYFFTPEVETSETEMRNMRTFGMIFKEIEAYDEDGVPYFTNNKGISYPDRLENALKDQIFVRDSVMTVYNGTNEAFANLYYSAEGFVEKLLGEEKVIVDVEDETDETAPVETAPPEGFADEYYDLKEETPEPPAVLDWNKYPGYGYARLATFPERSYTYRKLGSFVTYNDTDYVGTLPSKSAPKESSVKKHVDQYEKLLDEYPNLKFYSYFVTQMQDTPWFYDVFGVYPDKHETIAQYLPEYMGVARLTFSNFADYQDCYFKSDHHWAYKGSERAYRDVYNMMADELELSPVKNPIATWNFSELFGIEYRGSRANNLRSAYNGYDEFIAYEYDLGERETYVAQVNVGKNSDGSVRVGDYTKEIPVTMGLWERYKSGNMKRDRYFDHYINFYGRAYDQTGREFADSDNMFIIKNKDNGAKHNMLLVCDSSQRPYRDVLASHFGTLVTLDYRIIPYVPIDYIIETYNIDVIFFGGQSFAWSGSNQYLFRFSENFGK